MNDSTPVWFITGRSTGLGRALATTLLERGHRAVVTARDPRTVADLAAGHGDRALTLPLDVTDPAQVAAAVERAEAEFGRIDVLVNNTGYGCLAAVEEGEDAEIRVLFDTNVSTSPPSAAWPPSAPPATTTPASSRWRACPSRSPPKSPRSASG
ncbi:hypothetical protein GCM10010383_41270 [Streptomyces lomondensis]|uniref:Uncharacterized protein n=1 Tax=Streptomyces lomondensis TaxID=68229 RepID=A0ABQ2XAL5_9ACTN|nr:hypothetical protein GCM10010383_41270 [Streptomyces lomondensis]